jgi:hypothetical protein
MPLLFPSNDNSLALDKHLYIAMADTIIIELTFIFIYVIKIAIRASLCRDNVRGVQGR